MDRRLGFLILGILVSAIGNSLITILPSFSKADIDAIIYWLPFQILLGALIGLIVSFTRANWQLVAAGSIYAWMPGALATVLVVSMLGLSAEQWGITLYTIGVFVGTVTGLFPYWLWRLAQQRAKTINKQRSKD